MMFCCCITSADMLLIMSIYQFFKKCTRSTVLQLNHVNKFTCDFITIMPAFRHMSLRPNFIFYWHCHKVKGINGVIDPNLPIPKCRSLPKLVLHSNLSWQTMGLYDNETPWVRGLLSPSNQIQTSSFLGSLSLTLEPIFALELHFGDNHSLFNAFDSFGN